MRLIGTLLALVVGLGVIFGAAIYVASESGEVVVLTSRDEQGEPHQTRLWVVDHAGSAWLRTGNPQSQWLARVRGNPEIEVERGGSVQSYRGVLVDSPVVRDQINALVLQKYGWAEDLLRTLVMNPEDVTPVRLEPR